ncbi:MAG: Chemotaxis protein methyltransferase CheR [Myxococcales bacterium]|nr:Chemotaxis protein methyltransferase CheR [Myxococcales bacterium]
MPSSATSSSRRPRLWVLDDSPLEMELTRRSLAPSYDIERFVEGGALLERLAVDDGPDALLLDWGLPGMSGLEVCRFIRASRDELVLPILMLTGRGGEDAVVEALAAGANDYVAKPFVLAELVARVATLVRAKRLADRTRQLEAERSEERAALLAAEHAARAAAEESNRAKDEFLAMLGHELRNPLSPIVTALQLMNLRGDASTAKERLVIGRQVTHLVRLVDDLLDISKITRGKIELKKERCQIAEIVAKAVEMASPLLEQRSHHLSVDVARDDMLVEIDGVRIAQVIANLLTNAARYTPPEGEVSLTASRDGHEVVIEVKDNGIGIESEMLTKVFDLFVQGKRSSDRSEGGLGLGLSLVKNLVAMHGGSVVALSRGLKKGSEFVVRLPAPPVADRQPVRARLPEPTASGVPAPVRRILIVDDNEDAAELLSEILQASGHDVQVAFDGPRALELVDVFTPDLAILDIGLPVMDGYELATQLRSRLGAATPRLIALTGYGQSSDRARSAGAGFEGHLVKPVDPVRLLSIISRDGPE